MTPKPNAKTTPTQDEFDAWCLHPVTQFVAEAYRLRAADQRNEWQRFFELNLIPVDVHLKRMELHALEHAYKSFLEAQLADYVVVVEGNRDGGRPPIQRPPQRRAQASGRGW
jgi:hypothetical protein